ncbi:NnrU family protein [Elongatibacter sediminis]|uniref:NnrU family protein n=1 Tax=Elongatibacter sediminis TaxID=3119006 RepID=A0AAW9R5R2_9GAMM
MNRLGIGIALFSLVHLIPAVAARVRGSLIRGIGENPYKAVFSLISLAALFLIITGWRSASAEPLYSPPQWGRYVALLLVWAGFVLFPAPYLKSNVQRLVRHPQLTGVTLWGLGHLLANGESRSVLLFGGFAAWAVLERLALNHRDGPRPPPAPVGRDADLKLLAVGTVAYLALLFLHAWLFGVPPFPAAA